MSSSDLTEHELRVVWEGLKHALRREGLLNNCTQCFHWDQKKEICIKYSQRPPAKVIVHGCENFELDEIPF